MKSNLKLQHVILFIACFFISGLNRSSAKHMGLSSLTYTHLSGNLYHFQFIYYRDCMGVPPQLIVALNMSSVSCGVNQNVSMMPSTQGELITPVCPNASTCDGGQSPGIQKWIYETDVNIPGQCPDWKFSVSYYRNPYFTNVESPYNDAYAEARLDNSMHDNSSPVMTNEVIMFICKDQDFHFNNGFIDPDGDSLTYAMVSPMMTENSFITYNPGFDALHPVTSNPPVSFNSETGDLFMHPTMPEISIMSFKVNEYRNGVIVGSITRDIGFYIFNCNDAPPKLTGVNGTTDNIASVTAGTQLCFDIFSADNDQGDSLGLSWNNAIPSATFITSSAKHPTGFFCWTPSVADVRSSPYIFTATIRDDWCPMSIVQTYTYAVYVTTNPSPLWMNTAQQENNNKPIIYPNPSTGIIHIESSETIASISIYNHTGQLLISDKLKSSIYKIDEPAGVYLIEILFKDGRILNQKIIKK